MISSVVDDYLMLQASVDQLIKVTGYRVEFVADQMGMDRTSFYLKRKNKNFTPKEMKSFLQAIRADELEDKVLGEMSLEAERESETITLEQALSESRG